MSATNECKQMAVAFQRERDFLDAVLNSLPGVFYCFDKNGEYLRWNKNLEQVTGYTAAEIARASPLDFFAGADKDRVAARIRKVFDEGAAIVEADFVAKNGMRTAYYFTGSAAALNSQQCLVGLGIDISARKKAEKELRLANERMRRFVDANIVGIVVANTNGKVIEANDYYLRLIGFTREDMKQGRVNWPSITLLEWCPPNEQAIGELRERGVSTPCEKEYLRRDGVRVPVLLVKSILPGPEEQIVFFALDLTELKAHKRESEQLNAELEQRVRERTAQLEEANKELEAFSYSVSHDLRAPLRAINGFVSILAEDCAEQLDDHAKHNLTMVRSEAARMNRLIDDLLAFSRMGWWAIRPTTIDMGALAQRVFDECAAQEPGRKIKLKLLSVPPAQGDEALLYQVWTNFISNAIKYTRTKPVAKIEISSDVGDKQTVYRVKDNGVGFDMKYADRLFNVFQRLHSDADFEGTGVGLALARRIIERHGGRVWAEGKVDEGATFVFTLPGVSESAALPSVSSAAADGS